MNHSCVFALPLFLSKLMIKLRSVAIFEKSKQFDMNPWSSSNYACLVGRSSGDPIIYINDLFSRYCLVRGPISCIAWVFSSIYTQNTRPALTQERLLVGSSWNPRVHHVIKYCFISLTLATTLTLTSPKAIHDPDYKKCTYKLHLVGKYSA